MVDFVLMFFSFFISDLFLFFSNVFPHFFIEIADFILSYSVLKFLIAFNPILFRDV